jgi:hypothetical protein
MFQDWVAEWSDEERAIALHRGGDLYGVQN